MKWESIDTARLELRKWIPETFVTLYENCSPEEQIRFLGINSEEELKEEHRKYQEGLSTFNKKFLSFQLVRKKDERVLGWCSFHTWYIDHRRAELGYWLLHEDYKRMGYVSEAIPQVLKYGFTQMDLNRVEAFVSPENIPSLRIMEKFGFRREGFLRQHYAHNGKIDDSVLFGLLRQDYFKKPEV